MTATLTGREASAPAAVQLRNTHDFAIVVRSLEDRHEQIEKLAKKNEDDGYHREARAQRADAGAIKQFILPLLRGQAELPLATAEQVREAVVLRIAPLVRDMLVVRAPEDRQEDMLRTREKNLCERLALYIESYASAIAEEAYNAGYAARASDPEAIALRMVHALDA